MMRVNRRRIPCFLPNDVRCAVPQDSCSIRAVGNSRQKEQRMNNPNGLHRIVISRLFITWLIIAPLVLASSTVQSSSNKSESVRSEEYSLYLPLMYKIELPVYISPGAFQMGCAPTNTGYGCQNNELPLHTVQLSGYRIDKFEVTNFQYEACVDAGICVEPSSSSSYSRPNYYGNPAYGDFPVIYVDWFQAEDFCEYVGGRLPTEAEWEKAARGTMDTRTWPWGDYYDWCDLSNYYVFPLYGVWCVGDTTQIGTYPGGASPYSMLDMAGNVSEWVNDWYQSDYYSSSPDADPQGPENGTIKSVRGGSWDTSVDDVRVFSRSALDPTTSQYDVGFRCVYSP